MAPILILDFGSQYTQLIARRIRELNVYCEIYPYNHFPEIGPDTKGVILSGSPASVREENSPDVDLSNIFGKLPLLGICYGGQLLAQKFGGEVQASSTREYGRTFLQPQLDNKLLASIEANSQVWMSHSDTIVSLPLNSKIIGSTETVPVAAFAFDDGLTFGIQFHPEVTHTSQGLQLLKNFVIEIAGCEADFTPDNFVTTTVESLKEKIGADQVVMGLSGGVDSSVAAMLLHRAIGSQLICIFVDNGLLRKHEYEEVLDGYKGLGLNIKGVDAKAEFYAALEGLEDPELKRKAIGKTFIEVFERETNAIPEVKWLGQGTIYPDIIESVSVKGPSATIKSHHNVGGLPERMSLKVVEPLNTLFKDEVRRVGNALGLGQQLIGRHPFPGPGLAIRILGEVTAEKVDLLQKADYIFLSLLKERNLYDKVWQAGTILLNSKSVGVMGDERTYQYVVALRAVMSQDGMTADWVHLPYEFLAEVSNTIINKVTGINRVVYDISSKPPATIEWE